MKIAGNQGKAVFKGYRYRREPDGGQVKYAVYSGSPNAITGLANGLDVTGAPHEVDAVGPVWTLEHLVTPTRPTNPADSGTREERLRHNRIAKDSIKHPALVQTWSELGAEQSKVMIDMLAPGADFNDETYQAVFGATRVEAKAIYDAILSGETHFEVDQPTVTVTISALWNAPWSPTFINIGRTFTTAQMIDDADLVSSWIQNLPQDSPNPTGYLYGWVKHAPEILTAAGDRTQLVQEYEYGLWNAVLYPAASA